MSGICGVIQFDGAPVDANLFAEMTGVSAYLGPDGIDLWREANAALAHLALHTTVEASNERQPLFHQQSGLALVADALIYNRPELIEKLNGRVGPIKPGCGDAELILAAYRLWGEACPERLVGDFAFVVWDSARQSLFCARDALGVRPFYYAYDQQVFRFGSDLAQVMADGRLSRDLDGYALSDFMTYNWRLQVRTLFASVQRLPPGHCLAIDAAQARGWRYWKPETTPALHYIDEAQYVEHFQELLFRCVADHMRASKDRAAVMVSGGLDSSSIAAIAQKLYLDGEIAVQPVGYTFFPPNNPQADERSYSLALRDELKLEMHEAPFPEVLLNWENSAHPANMNQPFLALDTQWPAIFQQLKAQNTAVFMRGDGGDFLYKAAGARYTDDVRTLHWGQVWPWVQAARRRGTSWPKVIWWYYLWPMLPLAVQYQVDRRRPRHSFGIVPAWMSPGFCRRAHTAERMYRPALPKRFDSPARQAQFEDLVNWLTQTIMTELHGSRGRQAGLEFREPYLDSRLVEFLLAAPLELGARPGDAGSRWILRAALQGVLPEKIRLRTTKAFGLPTDRKALHFIENQDKIHQLFLGSKLASFGLVSDIMIDAGWLSLLRGETGHPGSAGFMRALSLELWLAAYASSSSQIRFIELADWQAGDYRLV